MIATNASAPGTTIFSRIRASATAHIARTAIAAIVMIVAAYWLYGILHPAAATTSYALATVKTGTIVATVSGSGQISPSNEVTINPRASGQVTSVLVKNGQHVATGQTIAYLNATDEYNAVNNAQTSLKSAQLSLQKLQKPATELQVTQDQNAVAKAQANLATDQTDLQNAYASAYSDVISTFLDLPSIQTRLQDIEIGTEASKGSQWNIDYYSNSMINWVSSSATAQRDNAYAQYKTASDSYTRAFSAYQLTTQSSPTSTIEAISQQSYAALQDMQNALNAMNGFLQYYENQVKAHNQVPTSVADTSITTLASDITKINAHLAALLADKNQIAAAKQSIINDTASLNESTQALSELQAGTDPLDIQSAELNVEQQQNALQQAQDNLANYTITAPFSGTIANLNLHRGDSVSSGTAAATLITADDLASLSLNEVDAAKVSVGELATLTFDAIPNLSLTGKVVDVSPLGTVTQGVVSYAVKIGFDTQDPRVKAGMSVNASIQTAVHSNVLTVPASAVTTIGGTTYVRAFQPPLSGSDAAGSTGIVSSIAPANIPVTVGISDNANTEIISGLSADEQIVSRVITTSTAKTAASTATSRAAGPGGPGGAGTVRI